MTSRYFLELRLATASGAPKRLNNNQTQLGLKCVVEPLLSSRQKKSAELPATDHDCSASVWVLGQRQASAAKFLLQ